jgi:hypothetical protein
MRSDTRVFHGEYLSELEIAERQLLAPAAAVPGAKYGWRPAEDTRSFSAVLVHVAAGNFYLLYVAGAPAGQEHYGPLPGDRMAQFVAIARKNLSLERTLTDKHGVADLLACSFQAVREAFGSCTLEELEGTGGESITVRRIYLRMLVHAHEHMGQAIAYARAIGIRVPWPDPVDQLLEQRPT